MADRSEQYYLATQWQLMWRKFRRHRLALLGGGALLVFYLFALLAQFIAPSTPSARNRELVYAPPQRVRLFHEGRLVGPFIYRYKRSIDPLTTQRIYTPTKELVLPLRFFVRGEPYRFWGLLETDLHLFGAHDAAIIVLGADSFGRDLFTRNLYAARVSLSVGLVGVTLSFLLGITLGGISGYYGGAVDAAIQRIIEFLISRCPPFRCGWRWRRLCLRNGRRSRSTSASPSFFPSSAGPAWRAWCAASCWSCARRTS